MLAERVFSTCVEKVVEQMDVAVGEAEKIWGALQVSLRDELSDAAWNTWFTGVHAETIAGDTLVLAAPSSVTAERIRSSYGGLIADTLVDLGGYFCGALWGRQWWLSATTTPPPRRRTCALSGTNFRITGGSRRGAGPHHGAADDH